MISKTVRENVLTLVKVYRKATGKSESQVSKKFYGNADFLAQLRSGEHSISVKKLEEMVEAFDEAWPEGTPWPALRPISMRRPSAAI